MFLIVGLGNPGIAYRNSRHNAGFMALDVLSDKLNVSIDKRAHKGKIAELFLDGQKVLLCKPQTYMNLSGECVQELMAYYKLEPEQLVVLYDDIDLPTGELRIRKNGSAGTHNCMRSIIACLGGEEGFPRIRIGVGRQEPSRDLKNHVLGTPSAEDRELLRTAYEHAADAAFLIVKGCLNEAQAKYNKKKRKPPKPEPEATQAAATDQAE